MPRYGIVPERSHIWMEGKSSVHPIHCSTDGLEGYLELAMEAEGGVDPAVKPAGKLSVAVSRLSSGNRMEDRELYKRVDIKRYPTIEGVIEKIDRSGDDGNYRVSGDITFRGTARHYEDQMTIEVVDDQTIQLAGRARFDIRDFGMEPPRMLMLRVEPEVEVRVEILAVREA